MTKPPIYQKLVIHILQFVTFLGTVAWSIYWLTFRVPVADWRFLAVGLLLTAVMGWWPWVSLVALVAVSAAFAQFAGDLGREMKIQILQEIAIFWALGLGWGVLAKRWLAPPPPALAERQDRPATPPPSPTPLRFAQDSAFRTSKLMAGQMEAESVPPSSPGNASGSGHEFLVFKPEVAAEWTAASPPSTPLPRPTAPSSPSGTPSSGAAYFGEEAVYLPSLPGVRSQESTQAAFDVEGHQASEAPSAFGGIESSPPPGAISPPPGAQTIEFAVENLRNRLPEPETHFVVPSVEFPTMELPINTLLRPASRVLNQQNSSFPGGPNSNPGVLGDASDSDMQILRRSSAVLRPETSPGAPFEHILEWYNQFSWAPWTGDELARRYHLPGTHVGWESLALADLAKAWTIWKAGPVAPQTSPGQVTLGALEGFLRCEVLGVLRQAGFPNLHLLSTSHEPEIWIPVYHEVRGRLRGGEALIRRADQGVLATDPKGVLVGRPDRFAEIRGESDVVSLVTPMSVGETLNWASVYAVAQMRVAETMGVALSGVPVVINLPLPIWDERRQCRVIVVEDVATEQRKLDIALERFNKVLSKMASPKAQTQSSVCNGCGWRHACSSYTGSRPRRDLLKPPPQIAVALR